MITYFDGMMKSFGIDRVHLFYADSIEIETIADAVWAIWALNTNGINGFSNKKKPTEYSAGACFVSVLHYHLSAMNECIWFRVIHCGT